MSLNNTHYGAEEIGKRLAGCKSIFFIGVGGINMSSLALISKKRGYRVGGSDRQPTDLTKRLESEGIEVYYEHNADNVKGYDAFVYTVAISPENPEYIYAENNGLLCVSRADYLGYVMTGYKNRIGVCGMHGKSTCTSMCAEVFMGADVDPTIVSGAELTSMGGAYRLGGEEHFIFEACEYMDSFLDFNPTLAVLLNIERDHVDYFHSMEQTVDSFKHFIEITGDGGTVVVNIDNDYDLDAIRGYHGNVVTFALEREADFTAKNIGYEHGKPYFDIYYKGNLLCNVRMSVTGKHNIYNALATAASAYICGIAPLKIASGLHSYVGAKRRMELKGKLHGADVYDDYGHHPTEVKTTLEGARGMCDGRLFCVFQPHTYTRTAELFDDFSKSFDDVDCVIFADIYAARETDTLGVSAERLAAAVGESALYLGNFPKIAEYLNNNVREDDTVVIMGAGDIGKLFPMLDLK